MRDQYEPITKHMTIWTMDKIRERLAQFVQCTCHIGGGNMIGTEMQPPLSKDRVTSDRTTTLSHLEEVVTTAEEFDRVVSQAIPTLLDRATSYTKRVLRETGQWSDDIAHEKFVLRWGAEYLERFLVCGRSEVPCRPLFLLDSFVAKQHSQPDPFCYHPDLLTPLGRYLDGLVARAVISRDALIALYHHCYGMGPRDVIAVTGLSESESQRIYKNFRRWRDSGWRRTMDEIGMTDAELDELIIQQQRHRQRFNHDTEQIIRFAQAHYRKSEPDHYPCLSRGQWESMFSEGYGCDYRLWHLVLCTDCIHTVWDLGRNGTAPVEKPRVELHVLP
jgi:hypothetical protein